MSRLIEADAAIDALTEYGNGRAVYIGVEEAVRRIEQLPSAEQDTTTHDSIPAETGKNDGDGTSGDCTSRTQAIEALRDYLVGKRCPDDGTLTCRLIENEVINKLPSIQPERKTGRWIYGESEVGNDGYYCSECGNFVPWIYEESAMNFIREYKFCPNCGAKMEGEKKE